MTAMKEPDKSPQREQKHTCNDIDCKLGIGMFSW